ncbi:MAG: hypothetical protein ACK5PF_10445 [bacterium]|jgi:hypothetical protein
MDQDQPDEFDNAFAEHSGAKHEDEPTPAVEPSDPVVSESAHAQPQPSPASDRVAELERQLAEALHRERSSANRIGERDRQANALADQVRQLQARLQELESARATPPADKTPADPDVLDGAEDLRTAVEKRVQSGVEPLQQKLSEAERRATEAEAAARAAAEAVKPIVAERQQQQLRDLATKLDDEFEGWKVEVKEPRFQQWLQSVPPEIQQLYQRADNFDVAARVLKLYSADTGHAFKRRSDPAPQQGSDLRKAVGIRPGVSGANVRPNPNDFDSAFAEFSKTRSIA